ncbi:EpsG family protein [uncultured Rikenella sp.]|uniref:EpsG family protein n=1 Tax=uncultured Rikenella sp. TaxID=368003 RepID=UPI00260CC0FB|nr:EpsG family protein [uncultured Rikenella sp.]
MVAYFVIFCLLAVLAFADVIGIPLRQRKAILIIEAILLALFAGLRYDTDIVDFSVYWEGYVEVARYGLDYARLQEARAFEPGYNLLMYLVSFFCKSPIAGFLAIATLSVGITLSCYQRYSRYALIGVVVYFSHTFLLRDMIQIRAGFAAAVALWALRYVEQQKPVCFFLVVLLAMSFHMAAGIVLLVYVVYRLNWSRRTWCWLVGMSLLVGLLMPLGHLLGSLPGGGIFQRIQTYVWMINDEPTGILTNLTILKQLFFSFICLKYWKKLLEIMPHFRLLAIPYLMSVCWLMLWNDFPIIAARIATFFSVTEPLLVCAVLYLVTKVSRPIATSLILIFAFLMLYLNVFVKGFPEYHLSILQ